MANVNNPFGLKPVQGGGASAFAFQVNRYYIPSTNGNAFYIGSPVIPAAAADTNGITAVDVGNGTDIYVGAVVGIEPANVNAATMVGLSPNLEQVSIPATKLRAYYVYVADDPNQIFLIQGDGTATNQVSTKLGLNCSLTITAPSPATNPVSATVVSSSTMATTNTLNIRLQGLAQLPNNAIGAYAIYRCKINAHALANAATAI